MSNEKAEHSWSVDHVEHKFTVDTLVDLAALYSAIKNDTGSFAPGPKKPFAKERGQLFVRLTFCDELAQNAPCRALVKGNQGTTVFLDVIPHRAGVRHGNHAIDLFQKRIQSDVCLARPPLVDRGLADIGFTGNLLDGDVPKMFFYPATGAGVHSAVIVMPGGGYTHLAIEKEGGEEARWLNEHGVTAFVLEYRLGPRYHFPSPMLDGARAVRYVRSHAAELDVAKDRIGLWGFSAGGHLAGYLATVHDGGTAGASGLPLSM